MEFTVNDPQWTKQRLDHFLQSQLTDMSRTRLQGLIKDGNILLNGLPTKPNTALKQGDTIQMEIPEAVPTEVVPQDIPLNILFEDEHLVVVNKAEGMVVHPAAGNADGTLVNALLFHCKNLSGIGGELRPGIVHRLDKETSGCIVVAKHDLAHTRLSEAFSGRNLTKLYLAAVNGTPKEAKGRIENRIGRHPVDRKRMSVTDRDDIGKEAVTEWERLSIHQGCALILCRLLTGRTHQIRVHMRESLGMAILGDTIYAQPQRQLVKVPRLMLHAWKLEFTHPITGQEMKLEAPVPVEYRPWMSEMRWELCKGEVA
jgi:23S rRNA pseudouridine1911/1915/1917 synthase